MINTYMWQFILGFTTGIYIGSFYDCKPTIEYAVNKMKENMPKEKK